MSTKSKRKLPKTRTTSRSARREALQQRIAMHAKAVEGIERRRAVMGDQWADACLAYRKGEIARLKAEL